MLHLCILVKVESTEFYKMHNMPNLHISYLQCHNVECMPCILINMLAYLNVMNASLSTCINHRKGMFKNHIRAKTAGQSEIRISMYIENLIYVCMNICRIKFTNEIKAFLRNNS